MNEVFDFLTEFNAVTVVIRVVLAALAGALVGLEREFHGRAAGMRTHMMVALGAALAAMIGLFTVKELGVSSDPMRVGAQVISGVGFLGAGMIVYRQHEVRGLTTAAGIWATAGVGMACGGGLWLIAVLAAVILTPTSVTLRPLSYVARSLMVYSCP